MNAAETWSDFTRQRPGITQTFAKAREAFGSIRTTIAKTRDICLDLRAVTEIHEAIRVLNQDGVIQNNPETAASAFGMLFGGFGRLAHRMPAPANIYAPILEECRNLFLKTIRNLRPDLRHPQLWEQI